MIFLNTASWLAILELLFMFITRVMLMKLSLSVVMAIQSH